MPRDLQIAPNQPRSFAAYLDANARFDVEGMQAHTAPDAVVTDERRRHVGRDAIRAWIAEASVGNQTVFVSWTWREDDGTHVSLGMVSGRFPGSPAELSFRLTLSAGAIATLAIS